MQDMPEMEVSNKKSLRGKAIVLCLLAVCVVFSAGALAVTLSSRAEHPTQASSAQSEPESEEPETLPVIAPTAPPPTTRDIAALEGKKLVALTFDDGPHPTLTPQLLDFLQEQDVRVTFFILGCNAVNLPDIPRRAAAEGHQVCNHTYYHKDLTKVTAERLTKEIEDTAALIEELTGSRPTAMRPPFGAQNSAVQAVLDTPLILWSVDPYDWSTRNADKTYQRIMEGAHDGAILLLHDYYPETIEAAKRIIPALKAQGYTFVTVDELLAARGEAGPGEVVRQRL